MPSNPTEQAAQVETKVTVCHGLSRNQTVLTVDLPVSILVGDELVYGSERRFQHVEGFGDDTDYLRWDGKQMWLHYKPETGRLYRESTGFDLATCERFVKERQWRELPPVLERNDEGEGSGVSSKKK